ncbi:hypothetical protein B0H63DRAFT_564613 [Podospora didyma]|uniref:FAD-dependent oxidoreductase 2 FAD-binding domain-containing protein n=1 Tax=Podospora didyma TaxID=330526 RepID=A0AAE0N4Z4_9PEZI|nr:hypothetical protein B0H63DRAFT_564613 [Podospora didyma]
MVWVMIARAARRVRARLRSKHPRDAIGAKPAYITGTAVPRIGATTPTTTDPDVVIVGGGLAGVCAAISAAEKGASVLVLGRGYSGGTSALSGGIVYAGGGTRQQIEAGYGHDTPDNLYWYMRQEIGLLDQEIDAEAGAPSVDDAPLRQFCNESVARMEWLEHHGASFGSGNTTRIPLQLSRSPSQEDLYGAKFSEAMIEHFGGKGFLLLDSVQWAKAKSQLQEQTNTVQKDLAAKIKVPALALKTTIRYNAATEIGAPDPVNKLEYRSPVSRGPFYAIDVSLRPSGLQCVWGLTLGGLRVDGMSGMVLDNHGDKIRGLESLQTTERADSRRQLRNFNTNQAKQHTYSIVRMCNVSFVRQVHCGVNGHPPHSMTDVVEIAKDCDCDREVTKDLGPEEFQSGRRFRESCRKCNPIIYWYDEIPGYDSDSDDDPMTWGDISLYYSSSRRSNAQSSANETDGASQSEYSTENAGPSQNEASDESEKGSPSQNEGPAEDEEKRKLEEAAEALTALAKSH